MYVCYFSLSLSFITCCNIFETLSILYLSFAHVWVCLGNLSVNISPPVKVGRCIGARCCAACNSGFVGVARSRVKLCAKGDDGHSEPLRSDDIESGSDHVSRAHAIFSAGHREGLLGTPSKLARPAS